MDADSIQASGKFFLAILFMSFSVEFAFSANFDFGRIRKLFRTSLSITKDIKWIDIDMEGIVRKKIRLLRSPKSKHLLNQLVDVSFTPNELLSQSYSLITCDLGDVETIKSKIEKILSPEERKFPTCLIFECVLGMLDFFLPADFQTEPLATL